MSFPGLQFVSSPDAATATLRYDFNLNTGGLRTLPLGGDGLDLGVPSFSGEPEGVGVDYGYRSIRLTQRIIGTKAVALARMSALAKELMRPFNWLKIQWDPSYSPVYFRTYRGEPGALSLEWIETAGAWDVVVPLVAEGFAFGPRVTVSTVQVVQSPADLAGPTRYAMHYILPTIKGDAPTPLRVTIAPASTSGDVGNTGSAWAIGCVAGTTGMADTVTDIGTGDGFTAGTGTGAGVSNSAYFGGSYRVVTITAGQALTSRLTGTHPTLPQGRYKVMLRYEADGSTLADQTYIFQWKTATGASSAPAQPGTARQVKVAQNAGPLVRTGWVDLGEFNYPIGAILDEIPPGQATPAVGIHTFDLQMTTAGTNGTVRIDAIKFIPMGGPTVSKATFLAARFPYSYWPSYRTSAPLLAISGTFDGDTDTYWSTAVAPSVTTGLMPSSSQLAGAFPMADPAAAQNMLIVMATDLGNSFVAGLTGVITSKDAQLSLDVSYYPRYLYVGDGT